MPKRKTTSEFVAEAVARHGERYDYSETVYNGARDKVKIICPEHGAWYVTPDNHLSKGRGCPHCGGSAQKTSEQFIAQARSVHGSRYDYSKVVYRNATTKVSIICREHGEFLQRPDSHLNAGHGCPICADKERGIDQRLSEAEINKRLAKTTEISGGRVQLVPGTYTGFLAKAQVACSVHGELPPRTIASMLSSPHPCWKCTEASITRGHTTETFTQLIRDKFDHRYELSPFVYKGKHTELSLVCAKHGEFKILAGSIYRSSGCPKCSYENSTDLRITRLKEQTADKTEQHFLDWIEKSKSAHGNKFDYSNVQYRTAREPVEIICPIHGPFLQTPDMHTRSGCRKCADDELFGLYSARFFELNPALKDKPALVYYIRFECVGEVFYKIGITTTTIRDRFSMATANGVDMEILGIYQGTLWEAWQLETELQSQHGDRYRYTPEVAETGKTARDIRIGPSECFSRELPAELVEMFEAP